MKPHHQQYCIRPLSRWLLRSMPLRQFVPVFWALVAVALLSYCLAG